MVRIPSHREPTHPDETLLAEFLWVELANFIHVPYQRVNGIVNTALRLAKFFGMPEDFRINLQLRKDLYSNRSKEYNALKAIKPVNFQESVMIYIIAKGHLCPISNPKTLKIACYSTSFCDWVSNKYDPNLCA